MPLRLTCACGQLLQVGDEISTEKIACPMCHAVVRACDFRTVPQTGALKIIHPLARDNPMPVLILEPADEAAEEALRVDLEELGDEIPEEPILEEIPAEEFVPLFIEDIGEAPPEDVVPVLSLDSPDEPSPQATPVSKAAAAEVRPQDVPITAEVVPAALPVVVGKTPRETQPASTIDKALRKKIRERRIGLDKLGTGLAVHFVSAFVFLPSQWTGWPALVLMIISLEPDMSEAAEPFTFLAISSGIFLILTALAEIAGAVFCLRVRDGAARSLLIGSLACRSLSLVLAVLVLMLGEARAVMLGAALAASLVSWVFWMVFLARVGSYLERPEFRAEALRTILSGLKTLIVTVGLLLLVAVMIMLIVWVKLPLARYALMSTCITVFLAFMRVLLAVGQFDSLVSFFLAPTAIPFLIGRQLPLVSSLRMVIDRRT